MILNPSLPGAVFSWLFLLFRAKEPRAPLHPLSWTSELGWVAGTRADPGAGWSEVLRQCGHRLRAAAVLVAVLPDPPPRLAAHPGEKEMKMDPS